MKKFGLLGEKLKHSFSKEIHEIFFGLTNKKASYDILEKKIDEIPELLKELREGKYLILESVNKKIKRDKFSAFEYGLYYIKILEDQNKKKKKGRIGDFMFYTPSKG